MEQAGVVFLIGPAEQSLHKTVVDVGLLAEFEQLPVRLQSAILGHSQKNDPVNDPLNRGVEVVCRQITVAQGEIARQNIAPAFDILQKFAINLGCAPIPLGGGVLVDPDQTASRENTSQISRQRSGYSVNPKY